VAKLESSVKTLIGTSVLNDERKQVYLNSVPNRKVSELRELEELMKSMQKPSETTQNFSGAGPTVNDPVSVIDDLTNNADPSAQPLELPSIV